MSTPTTDIPETAVTHEPCCSSHNVPMTCETYRRTHFVQVRPCCSVDAQRLDAEIGLSDEAWIDVVAAVGWDESNELWPVLQKAVAAALPIVLASRDEEHADLVAEVRQKDADLEEWRTGVLRLSASRDSETAELRAEIEALKAKLNDAYQHIGEQALIDMEEPIPPYGSPERDARVQALRGEQ